MSVARITNTNIFIKPAGLRCLIRKRIFPRELYGPSSARPVGHGLLKRMKFPVVLHKDPDSDYGVAVPDLPGCFSAGPTVEAALDAAVEAIECHIEGLLTDGLAVPPAKPVEKHRTNRDYAGGLWALVDVDPSKVSGKAKRVNITLPEHLLTQIDSFAAKTGDTRSGFLVHAAMEYVTAHQASNAVPAAKRRAAKKQGRTAAGV